LRKFDVEVDEQVMRSAEKESLLRARGWGLGVGETDHTDDLQLLADLQHFSVPTRLVDVTSNPMTALWFACQAAPSAVSASGILVALNITGWPHFASLGNPYEMTYDRMDNPKGAALEKAVSDGRPFVVDASVPNARLRAQEGFFVASAHPEQLRPVDSPFVSLDLPYQKGDAARLASALNRKGPGAPRKVPFVAVFINAQLKRKLSKYLEQTYNRSERVLFPDFTGFARWWERLGR
jgi:hypothetical protein